MAVPAALAGGLEQRLNFLVGEVLARAELSIRRPARRNCPVFARGALIETAVFHDICSLSEVTFRELFSSGGGAKSEFRSVPDHICCCMLCDRNQRIAYQSAAAH